MTDPGRELDSEIARILFQYLVIYDSNMNEYFLSSSDMTKKWAVPKYSTNVQFSHLVIKKMGEFGFNYSVESRLDENVGLYWRASFHTDVIDFINGKSLSHAICLAALKVIRNIKK